jgi:hypothetical protein
MDDTSDTTRDPVIRLENFAAELTSAVYPFLLRRSPKVSWLEVELDLWKALRTTVERRFRQRSASTSVDEREAWREGLLADLTETALYVVLKTGTAGSLLDLQVALYRTVRLATRKYAIKVRHS